MSQVQAVHDDRDERSASTSTSGTGRVLEDSDGVVFLARGEHEVAQCIGVSKEERDEVDTSFICWKIRSLSWSHRCALLFLQGVPIQQLLSPYVLLAADIRPSYMPRPGLDNVTLIEVIRLDQELKGPKLFFFFIDKLKGR